jgi:hypothetical protein
MIRRIVVLAMPLLLGACAVETTLRNEIVKAESGIAAVCTSTQKLLDSSMAAIGGVGTRSQELLAATTDLMGALRDGLAANASSTRATTAAIASTTHELDLTLAGLRPNLVSASADAAATLANVREATGRLKDRAEAPMPAEIVWILRIVSGAVVALLLHAVWSHLHMRRLVREITGRHRASDTITVASVIPSATSVTPSSPGARVEDAQATHMLVVVSLIAAAVLLGGIWIYTKVMGLR